ncbi:MAG: hypothetical protein QW680_10780 [Pyrobaculum sp.]|jgi:hypothetical protein
MRLVRELGLKYLAFSPAILAFPYLSYGPLVSWDPSWGFRMGVGLMGLGHYLYLVMQVAYYACKLPPKYIALSTAAFLAYFLSLTRPELVVLSLVGLIYSAAVVLYFGVKDGVFANWLGAIAWLFLWNLIGGVLSIPAHIYFCGGDIWLWWREPPADPLYALAVGIAGAVATWALGKIRLLVEFTCR